jgi:23S rRNA (guanosine2251-2'-O)-methyltransferase
MKNNKNDRRKESGRKPPRHRAEQNRQKSKSSAPTTRAKLNIDLFGKHAVAEAWINPARHIHNLYITQNTLDDFDEALKIAHDRKLQRPVPKIVEKSTLDGALSAGSVHQGIALSCKPLEYIDLDDIIRAEQVKETGEKSVILMLDQVTDPHNVGAIIRSACAFGAAGMVMQNKHAPELTGVLAKTACGGVEHLSVAYETNLTRSLETLQAAGYFAVGLDEHDNQTLSNIPDYAKLVLVCGAEGTGLRRLVREQCDIIARLPTAGPVASLNVSNAAAVALYAVLK